MIGVVLHEQIFGIDLLDQRHGLPRVRQEEAGDVAGVDRLDQQADAGLLQFAGRMAEVFPERVMEAGAFHAVGRDAGEAVDPGAAERAGIVDGPLNALAELSPAVGEHGDAALARGPVARRQVVQHEFEFVAHEALVDRLLGKRVGKQELDAAEAGAGGLFEAVEKVVLVEEQGEVGGEIGIV